MGDGDSPVTGYTSLREFHDHCVYVDGKFNKLETALWGSTGTNGMVRDIHEVKMQLKTHLKIWMLVVSFISTVIGSVLTTLILGKLGI